MFGLILYLMERSVMLVRRVYARCPHAGCHEPVPLPVVHCPNCNVEHTRLIPGRYGFLWRECQCGYPSLPTTFWLGRASMPCYCPECAKPLLSALFGASVHVPIYGGPSAGKTMYMMATSYQLLETGGPDLSASMLDPRAERDYERSWKPAFESGQVREKTVDILPDAFLLGLKRKLGMPLSLYLYDPAGEALIREEELKTHKFLDFVDGIAILIDPLTIESLSEVYAGKGGPDVSSTTSKLEPREAVQRVVNVLESRGRLTRGAQFARRVAVILTKVDLPSIAQELGVQSQPSLPDRWDEAGQHTSATIRVWLDHHEPGLVQLLEMRFAQVRYFAVSSQGQVGTGGKAFSPIQALTPLIWLLSSQRILTRPILAFGGYKLAELLAVGAVLAPVGYVLYQVMSLLLQF